MLKFQLKYFIAFVILLVVEILIALYFHDSFVRPFVGDVLVVILMYCFTQSFVIFSKKLTALSVLIFAFLIEILQYFRIAKVLGLENSKLASTLIGTSFEWMDLLAYTLGIAIVLVIDDHR